MTLSARKAKSEMEWEAEARAVPDRRLTEGPPCLEAVGVNSTLRPSPSQNLVVKEGAVYTSMSEVLNNIQ